MVDLGLHCLHTSQSLFSSHISHIFNRFYNKCTTYNCRMIILHIFISLEPISTPIIAFKATGIKNISPVKGEVLVFPTVLFNAGNGYDASNGIFTAPEDGLYLFTSQICVSSNKFITASIMVEDTEVGRFLTHDLSSTSPCNTGDAIVEVKAGQKVLVKTKYVSGKLYTNSSRLLSFSGALLTKKNELILGS